MGYEIVEPVVWKCNNGVLRLYSRTEEGVAYEPGKPPYCILAGDGRDSAMFEYRRTWFRKMGSDRLIIRLYDENELNGQVIADFWNKRITVVNHGMTRYKGVSLAVVDWIMDDVLKTLTTDHVRFCGNSRHWRRE